MKTFLFIPVAADAPARSRFLSTESVQNANPGKEEPPSPDPPVKFPN